MPVGRCLLCLLAAAAAHVRVAPKRCAELSARRAGGDDHQQLIRSGIGCSSFWFSKVHVLYLLPLSSTSTICIDVHQSWLDDMGRWHRGTEVRGTPYTYNWYVSGQVL